MAIVKDNKYGRRGKPPVRRPIGQPMVKTVGFSGDRAAAEEMKET
jgi:hypothetical protein